MVFRCLVLLLVMAGCSSESNISVHELPSGKKIRITGVGVMHFSEDEPALMMKYLTDIPIDDVEALRVEALEIWSVFKVNVENSKLTTGIVSAQGPAEKTGLISTTNRSYQFIWKKQKDGSWLEIGKKNGAEKNAHNNRLKTTPALSRLRVLANR